MGINNYYPIIDISNEIKNIIKKNNPSYKKEIVEFLISFFISDKFFAFYGIFKKEYLKKIIYALEKNEKLLFFKILFPLLEELKNKNFENQLKKLDKYKEEEINNLQKYIMERNIQIK